MKAQLIFRPTLIAVSVSLAFPLLAFAEDDDLESLLNPNVSEISLKLQQVDKVNPLYRQYYGLNHQGLNGSVDINFVQRSEDGRWLKFQARDLGLSTQEFQAVAEQQGDWALKLGYDQLPHYSPFKVNTAVKGVGSNSLTLPSTPWGVGAGYSEYDLKTERTATSIAASKFISEGLQANFSFKNEDKKGTRMSGSGGNSFSSGGKTYSSQFFTPEPIDATHNQFEASLDYTTKKFQLSGGYYGSFYQNNAGNGLFVGPTSVFGKTPDTTAGTTLTTLSTNMSPLALPPDNHMQQLYLNGGYNWSDATRATFNAAKSIGIQNDSFISAGVIVPGTNASCGASQRCPATVTSRSSLDAKVDTTNLGATITSRVTKELNVLASWSYEDRKDKTPLDNYLIDYSHGGATYTNNPESMKTTRGRLEASYRLPMGYRLTAGYDYDEKKYEGMADEGYRDKMQEDTYRVALRKSMSETVNGSVILSHSNRTGSAWGSTPSSYGDHWIAPVQFSDRQRDKVKLLLDWSPLDNLDLQFAFENAYDDYASRVNDMGLDSGRSSLYTLDVNYQLSDSWRLNSWYSLGNNKIKQNERQNPRSVNAAAENIQSCSGASGTLTCNPWSANLKLRSEGFGAGIQGKITSKLEVGAQYLYSHDRNVYDISVGGVQAGSNANSQVLSGAGVLPDTVYSVSTFRLFGKYPVAKTTVLRLDYIYDRRKMDDYTWSNWRYSDGTTVFVDPVQTTQILGLTIIQSF